MVVLANPLTTVISEARHVVSGSAAPTAASVAGGAVYLLIPAALTLLVVAAGAVLFPKISPKAAEYV